MEAGTVDVVNSKGCSRVLFGVSSLSVFHSVEPISLASSSMSDSTVRSNGPFSGLVICVTGLSKEVRKEVMAATERLGGGYSSDLSPLCTHLVVQNFGGRKFDHAMKHGSKNGLFVVTLGWFVDSVRRNVRLSESGYCVKGVGRHALPITNLNGFYGLKENDSSCFPSSANEDSSFNTYLKISPLLQTKNSCLSKRSIFVGNCIFIDSNVSEELQKKTRDTAAKQGAKFVDRWFIGCGASHVVCEDSSIQRYIGQADNLVSPLWILKSAKESNLQRLVHLSSDLARHVATVLYNVQENVSEEDTSRRVGPHGKSKECPEERQTIIDSAKIGVANRRSYCMQICRTPLLPMTPNSLLEHICWTISEPTSTVCVYSDSSSEETNEHLASMFEANNSETSLGHFSHLRSLRESEKAEVLFKYNFLTILFPIDQFGEMGPSLKTFYSYNGFTCLQVLEHIYSFYQDYMTLDEINVAIHTDSKQADKLRSSYSSTESTQRGFVLFKRIDFLGSRLSFEMLKRVHGDNNNHVYELIIRS